MLGFSPERGLGAEIEGFPTDKINEPWARVVAGDVRYRFVIDTSTLTSPPHAQPHTPYAAAHPVRSRTPRTQPHTPDAAEHPVCSRTGSSPCGCGVPARL